MRDPETRAVVDHSDLEGRVAFQLVPDPGRVKPALLDQQVFMPPMPLESPLPRYPRRAVVTDSAPIMVAVRIFVEVDGSVGQVLDSPLGDSTEARARDLFRAAVEKAVRGWKFEPGRIQTLTQGKDIDGDGKPDYRVAVDETFIRTYLDLRFNFELVGGKGLVRVE